ncbi:hypothetical protein ACAG25_24560 [Mycobacterium sp. pV006]|uniref:hypothetical protein n=1 Tax=Mycobacterium sp. pV006 TaxID=3238983 RepID=UPI00351B5775
MSTQSQAVMRRPQEDATHLRKQRSLISPVSLGYLYLLYALIAFFFPSGLYESLIFESYVAGRNIRMLLFSAGCVLCLHAGIAAARLLPDRRNVAECLDSSQREARRRSVIAVALIVIGINLASAWVLLRQNYSVIVSALLRGEQTGHRLKTELATEGTFLTASAILILVAWALYALRLSGDRSRPVFVLMLSSILLSILTSTIKLARYELLPLIIGLAVIKLLDQYRKGYRSSGRRFWMLLLSGGVAFGAFVLFAYVRGQSSDVNSLWTTVAGYSLASFNRLAALLDGQLVSSYGGTGAFALNFLSNLPIVGSMTESLLPSSSAVYAQEFRDVGSSGLDGGYIWLTMYGYYFADLGLWVFLFCFGLGIVSQLAWRDFEASGVVGTAAYPYLASAMIMSFASYWVTRPFITAIGIFLVLYVCCIVLTKPSFRSYSARTRGLQVRRARP